MLVCHRRFGKTTFAVNHALRALFSAGQPGRRYAIVLPLYRQAKQVAWDMLKDYSRCVPIASYNEAELRADFGDIGRIQLFGGDDPDTLRGQGFDGVVMDEVAQMDPRLWGEVIRPALVDRKGWAIFLGTPRGRNAFYDLVQLTTYCLMLGMEVGNLVQCARAKQGSTIHITRIEMSEEPMRHADNWHAHVLPALYAFADAVHRMRASTRLRHTYLVGGIEQRRRALAREVPHLSAILLRA